ncbi:MAG: restriction endonuclease subunit S [Bacteroidales bacterium]|nr:restriction endonuclease subunit S [Bacteroidales bacterium]
MKLLEHFHELSLHPKNAKELKGLILQLALQGKLSKNFREKNQFNNKNNIVDGYYSLPESWYWDKFNNICVFRMGKTPPSKEMEYWDGEIPWVSIADMTTHGFISNTKKKISTLALQNFFNKTKVREGTLLMSFKLTIGKTSILKVDACHNEAIISIYPNDNVTKQFLFLFLPIISNWGTQVSALMGNTLNKGKIQSLKVPIPPISEQHTIVSIVEQLFKEVEQLEKLTEERIQLKEKFAISALDKLNNGDYKKEWDFLKENFHPFFNEEKNIKKLRETILQLAVQGKLTEKWRKFHPNLEPAEKLLEKIKTEKEQLIKEKKIKKEKPLPPITKDDIPYKLPDGWVWCRLQSIGLINPKNNIEDHTDVSFIPMKLVSQEYGIQPKFEIRKWKEIKKGFTHFANDDVVIAKITPCFQNSKAGIMKDLKNNSGAGTTELLVYRTYKTYLSPDYVYIFFKTPSFLQKGVQNMTGTAGQQRVPKDYVFQTPFPFPPLEEQKAIVEKVNTLMALCDKLENGVKESKEQIEKLMKAVLREVFEDKKEVKELPQTECVASMAAEEEIKYGEK